MPFRIPLYPYISKKCTVYTVYSVIAGTLFMQARNNRALCHVYQDNVKEVMVTCTLACKIQFACMPLICFSQAISVMEQLIRSSPAALLQPTLLSNLSELYDVRVNSQAKRLSLMPLLAEHAGDAFNISALSTR